MGKGSSKLRNISPKENPEAAKGSSSLGKDKDDKISISRKDKSENLEAAKGSPSLGKDKGDNVSISRKDEMISKLRELNQILIGQRESLKEERESLKEESEAAKKREDNWKETEIELRKDINGLQEQLNDVVKQHSNSVQKFKVTEKLLNEQNEMLHKEVEGARCLLEMENQRVEDFLVENSRLKKQLEKKEKKMTEFKSLHAKYRDLDEKHLEWLKENEEQKNMILSLKREKTSLANEKSWLLQSLNEETKRCQELLAKCLKSDERVLYLESQSLGLQTEVASAKSAYDEIAVQLNKNKEDMNTLSNDSHQIKEENEALHQNLMSQLSINKELEEELLSTKSSFDELKESASKTEQQIAMLQSQLFYVTAEKDSQIFEIQCELCAMVIRLANLQDLLSSIADEKRFLEEKNSEIKRKKLVLEEEQVHLKSRIAELERYLDFHVNKDLESSIAEEKRFLAEKNSEIERKKLVSEEEQVHLKSRIGELERDLDFHVNKDLESSIAEEKRFLAERNSEIERKQLVSEEEQVHLKRRIGELERDFDFVNKDLESSRAMAVEKECQLADLQYQLSDLGEAKRCLWEENNSLRTELNKCIMDSKQTVQLLEKTWELESALESVKMDLQSRDGQLQQLITERQHLQPDVNENGNSNSFRDNGITDIGYEEPNSNSVHENVEPEVVHADGKPNTS